MDDMRTRFKQEPLSPGQTSRHGHDLMAMQQTYHQGEVLSRSGTTQGALDMSQSGRTATIAAGMPYIPDGMTSYALTTHDVSPAYAIQDRNLMLGMYGYAPVISEGKGAGHVDLLTNGMEGTEVNGCDVTGPQESAQPKLRNTALPGMGKRSHLPKRYKCAMCAYRTRYKSDLNRHVRKHAVATFNCEICNMPFKTIGNVEFHKRKEHADLLVSTATATSGPRKDQPPKHSCKHCDYSTSYSSDLTRHVRKHLSSKFHCILCNRPFMTFSSLATHKRSAHNTSVVVESEEGGGIAGEAQSLVEGGVTEENEAQIGDGATEEGGASDVEMVEEVSASPKPDEARERPGTLSMQQVNGDSKDSKIMVEDENRNIAEKSRAPDKETEVSKDQSSPTKISNSPDNVICTKYTCEYCDKSFGRKLVLEYHLKNIHKIVRSGQEDADVFVEYPDDDYDLALDMSIQELENSTSDGLADRTPLDTNDKLRHQCQLCAYGTNYKSTFDRHVRKHDLECHICDICRMPFITFGHLQRHIRDNHPEHAQTGARKDYADGHQDRAPVSARKEAMDGRSVIYDFQSNDSHPRITNPSSPSRCKMECPVLPQSPFHWMTVNKPSVQSSGKSENVGGAGTKLNWANQRRVSGVEEGVTTSPPSSGRYAKLVSDYDSFAEQPFACALCFYRTGDVSNLVKHAENHLTGCSLTSVPDTCMFRVGSSMLHGGADQHMKSPVLPTYNVYAQPSAEERSRGLTTPNNIAQSQFMYTNRARALMTKTVDQETKSQARCVLENQDQGHQMYTQEKSQTLPYQQQTEAMGQQASGMGATGVTIADSQRRNDRMIPTFSVHYRKDKTNKVRPYLCLLCRKRFRHLMLLKQHFKVAHSESQVGTPRFYTCRMCKEVFNNPMLLQEHHDINH